MKFSFNLKPIEELRYTFFVNDVRVGYATLILGLIAQPIVAIFGLVALYCARWSSDRIGSSSELDESGIIAVNGFFFGAYMGYVYQVSVLSLSLTVLGGWILPALTNLIARVAKSVRAPVLVFPFIILVWGVSLSRISTELLAWNAHVPSADGLLSSMPWAQVAVIGGLRGFSQILYSTNIWIGLGLLLVIGRLHVWKTLSLMMCSAAASLLGWLLRADQVGAALGHYAFGAVLLALFLEFKYPKPGFDTWGMGVLAYGISFLSMNEFCRIIGVPALTLSYCFAAWIVDSAQSVKAVGAIRVSSEFPAQVRVAQMNTTPSHAGRSIRF